MEATKIPTSIAVSRPYSMLACTVGGKEERPTNKENGVSTIAELSEGSELAE